LSAISRAPTLRACLAAASVAAATACARTADVEPPPAHTPPAPVAIAIDSALLLRDVGVLAHDSMQGRGVATPGSAKARAYIESRFRTAGLQPFGSTFLQPFTFSGRGQQIQGVNIVGQLRGTALPERYIVITAHYDHVGVRNGEIYNGADDNASGTAALFALADHFREHPPRHSLIFVAFDAEESGLQGARAFVASPPVPKQAIVLNINMDMISRNDAGELYVAGTYSYPQLRPHVERAIAGAQVKLIAGHDRPGVAGVDDWTSQSDHGAFHAAGIPFLYFGVEDHADYHRATDDVERIQPDLGARAVRTVITAMRILDAALN
jgi:Zn-dependent M28 family amino/carboxypeptidase